MIEEARGTEDNAARYELYAEAEDILFGEDGDVPVLPIYFYTYAGLEREIGQGHASTSTCSTRPT